MNYWIDPTGKVHRCASHDNFAKELLCDHLYDYESSTAYLHSMGWVRLQVFPRYLNVLGNTVDLKKPMRNTIDPAMNQRQIRTVKSFLKDLNLEYDHTIFGTGENQ